jgi:uncharacterized protein YfaS (alpha-2-macroglobulin family)
VIAAGELEFSIKDEDGTTLYRETVKTSVFGIAAISWKIPEGAKLGSYRVEVEAGDEELEGGEMSFKVSRYELPQFAVTAKPDKTFYLPNETRAEVTVRADYLSANRSRRAECASSRKPTAVGTGGRKNTTSRKNRCSKAKRTVKGNSSRASI